MYFYYKEEFIYSSYKKGNENFMKKISAVIPIYYEEEVAQECYNRMSKVLKEISNYEYVL